MNAKKKMPIEDDLEEEEEEEIDDDDDEFEEDDEVFKCRVCGKDFTYEDGDDYVLICDDCAEGYNMDQIWADFESDKITEPELKKMDLKKYKYEE